MAKGRDDEQDLFWVRQVMASGAKFQVTAPDVSLTVQQEPTRASIPGLQ